MADIKINDIQFTSNKNGSDLFIDSEGFMKDLSDDELTANYGGLRATCNSSYACSGRPIKTCTPN